MKQRVMNFLMTLWGGLATWGSAENGSKPPALYSLLFRKGWRSILYILFIELLLCYSIPSTILHDMPLLNYFVDTVQHIAPIIGKFDTNIAAHPDAVRLYLALTLFLLIPKTSAIYYWLNRGGSSYSQLVVSPLTDTHAGNVGEYIAEPVRGKKNVPVKKRSWGSRIFWSILIFAFTAGMLWANLNGGSPSSSGYYTRQIFRDIGRGDTIMWYQWSIKQMTFLAFLLAISMTVGRDYFSYFKQKFSGKTIKGDE